MSTSPTGPLIPTVVVNYSEYERLKASLKVLGDRDLMRQIRRSLRFYAKGRTGASFDDVLGEPLRVVSKRRR